MNKKANIVICKDIDAVMSFLYKIDNTLPVPLSARVDMLKFATGNLERGFVYGIEEDGELVCAAIFYYHFRTETAAYLDLLATVPGYSGRGYASQVMDAIENAARQAGMTEFHLHTNDTNKAALFLYGKRGYEIIKTDPKIQMRKYL